MFYSKKIKPSSWSFWLIKLPDLTGHRTGYRTQTYATFLQDCLYSKDGFGTSIFTPYLLVVYTAIWTPPGQNR